MLALGESAYTIWPPGLPTFAMPQMLFELQYVNPGIINVPTPLQWHKELAFVRMLALVELLHPV